MSRLHTVTECLERRAASPSNDPEFLKKIIELMGIDTRSVGALVETLPFSGSDATAGTETELQAAVIGRRDNVDLPIMIEQSNYYANIMRRTAAGDTPRKVITDLERWLAANRDNVWENSWVRFPLAVLSSFAKDVFRNDLLSDKQSRNNTLRSDAHKFVVSAEGEEYLRVPLSYLLKLALADVVSAGADVPRPVHRAGCELMEHFLSDNTSPETHSFWLVFSGKGSDAGKGIAGETLIRFLLTQLLIMYANRKFCLAGNGQKAVIFSSPHPPVRQKWLNDCVSDAFYRELFMNPCLSGWDRGELKLEYMHLCHGVLSRSQLNAVAKLKEAGILTRNLVVLPNLSNISLANNGTHISLGSRRLSKLLSDPSSGFTRIHEKYVGDLVIKITEHFLPLFVGTYSAAPYRFDFEDFHPEKALGFLPHELDYTHLRMFWRRWKKKAHVGVMGRPLTPFGIPRLDRIISGLFGLRGDYVPDLRLIDYPVMLMSTEKSPALDGKIGNSDRLKKDLSDLGIFDAHMSLYILYKLREYEVMGFSGFEGRHYSLFENYEEDMGRAAQLQILITALAYKYIAMGLCTHAQIPDDPFVESERRQVIFGTAAGIPTFFVRSDTRNLFMQKILLRVYRMRRSRRYPGYLRVHNEEYQRALVRIIEEDAADLIDILCMKETIKDLVSRLDHPDEFSTAGRLTRGIVEEANTNAPMKLSAKEFNSAAERYYRERLRKRHLTEALQCLEKGLRKIERCSDDADSASILALRATLGNRRLQDFLRPIEEDVVEDRVSLGDLVKLIHLSLIHTYAERRKAESLSKSICDDEDRTSPIPGSGIR
ncbi:MAG TPA: hypothetical protein P5573_01725 [Syntrophales bacterium]|nr:hypothetical protein [Syntrophales bacterium]